MTARGKKAARRESRKEAALARKRRRRIITWSAGGVVIAGALAALLFQPLPEELSSVERFADLGGGHLAAGEAVPEYNSDPPTSGAHSPSSASCGIYVSEVPDVTQLHNLEHGTVVIQYQPDLDPAGVQTLQQFARSKTSHILVAPRTDLSHPVVVTSWTRMIRLQSADLNTIGLYYDEFVFTGPEVGVPCTFQVDEAA